MESGDAHQQRMLQLAAEALARVEEEQAREIAKDEAANQEYVEKMQKAAEQAKDAIAKAEAEQAKELGFHVIDASMADAPEWAPTTTNSLPTVANDTRSGLSIGRRLRVNTFFINFGRTLEENFARRGFEGYGLANGLDWCERVERATGGTLQHKLPTGDGRFLQSLWVEAWAPGRTKTCNAVAVIFHANAMLCLDMASWAKWYAQRGISALCVTMGGYAGSDLGKTSMTELSTYFDAQAAIDFAKMQTGLPNHRIIVHGLSIGGGLACAAAMANPGVHCTIDQTFVNSEEVAMICVRELSRRLPEWIVKQAVQAMFGRGQADPRLPGYTTDGYDNENKARNIKGQFFCFWASEDDMMPPGFSLRLFNARYEKEAAQLESAQSAGFGMVRVIETQDGRGVAQEPLYSRMREKRMACIEGWHCTYFGYDERASKVYERYLAEILELQEKDLAVRSRQPKKDANPKARASSARNSTGVQ